MGTDPIELSSDEEEEDGKGSQSEGSDGSEDDEAELGASRTPCCCLLIADIGIDRLKSHWTSPAYSFFKDSVEVKYDDDGRKYQWFTCAATPCKGKGGVKRYQDKTDSKGTGNLISHARRCFGADFVDEVCSGQGSGGGTQSGDIRAAFARMTGAPQQPEVSTRPLTSKQTR